jgi:hypothetical protein
MTQFLVITILAVSSAASAQSPAGATPPTAEVPAKPPDPDRSLVPSEPDFTLAALPTSLRIPRHKFAFRFTHRFNRSITEGSVGDFFANFFNFDTGARVGLELRFGLRSGTQIAVHRTSERIIQFLGQQEIIGQGASHPLTIDLVLAADGLNNFSQTFGGTAGAIASRKWGDHGAVYIEPLAVFNSTTDRFAPAGSDGTFVIGLGARLRLGASRTYVVIEGAPRVTGDRAGVDHFSVGVERRAGGHVFQFNVSNSLGTTFRELAHGGPSRSDWYIGFNLSRKFF